MKHILRFLSVLCLVPVISHSATIVYEDSFGSRSSSFSRVFTPVGFGYRLGPGGTSQFDLSHSALGSPASYSVSFDFYISDGAVLQLWFDSPQRLVGKVYESELTSSGLHNLKAHFNVEEMTVDTWIDGKLDASIMTSTNWSIPPEPTGLSLRSLAIGSPGSSNQFVYRPVTIIADSIPEPSSVLLILASITALTQIRKRTKQST